MSDQQSTASTSRPGSPIAPLPDFSTARPYRFAWDAATHKPGPASVSGASEGRGDYFAYKPSLGNFNVSSASLALGAIPPEWSSAKYGFNAISTLVNNPHKKSQPPKAHASVPPIIPSQLPRVRRKDFDAYLKSVAPEWERFEKATQLGQEGQADIFAARLKQLDSTAPSPSNPPTPRAGQMSSLPPLEIIPSVFFEPGLDLNDSKTFSAVTEQHEGDGQGNDPTSLSHSLPLLEKLSHYADTIELHLIREISLRSSSFFAALTNLNELQTESTQCLERIRALRGSLREVDNKKAKKGLELVCLERKAKNMNVVREGVKTMQGVGDLMGAARSLANGAEWDAALNVIDGLGSLWKSLPSVSQQQPDPTSELKGKGKASKRNIRLPSVPESIIEESADSENTEPKPLELPLSLLTAFSALPEQLQALSSDIASSLTSELIRVLKTDLFMQIDSLFDSDTQNDDSEDTREERLTMLADRLRPLAQGLKRTRRIKESVSKWGGVALVEIKLSTKRLLPWSEELDLEEQSASKAHVEKATALRDQLRDMTHEEFVALMRSLYKTLLIAIQGLQTQNVVFLEVLQKLSPSNESEELTSIQNDFSDMLFSATELTHSRASKILSIRSEKHASLNLPAFLTIFNETWNFVIKTETMCRRMVIGLRGTIVSQAKAFLQAMHQNRISESAKFVEEEQWSASEVSAEAQALANLIVDSAVHDSNELLVSDSQMPVVAPQANDDQTRSASSKYLMIEDRKYYAVSATLHMLGLLVDYLKVITSVSLLTTDAVGRIIEFLKAFNSRTCQVVLGAGAMRSAGLKNITAKHLALASQSLSIVIALIPYIRESFRRHLNPKQAVMLVEFDKLKRDYQEHQQEIHAKLIAIMGDRLNAHCKTLSAVDWTVSKDGVNEYMTVLVKETVTLHKVLSRYLQDSVLEYIMTQVFAAINHRLSEEYNKIELPTQEAKDRLMRDAHYLNQHFSGLKNTNASSGMLETFVREKQIPLPPGSRQSPSTVKPPAPVTPAPATEPSPQSKPQALQTNLASTMESANVRLKGIFRRSSAMHAAESKSPVSPPTQERRSSGFLPEKPLAEEPRSQDVSFTTTPPPLTPAKEEDASLNVPTSAPNSRPASPTRSPRLLEKALPIPLPMLNSEGVIVGGAEEILNLPPTPSAIDEFMEKQANGGPHLNGT